MDIGIEIGTHRLNLDNLLLTHNVDKLVVDESLTLAQSVDIVALLRGNYSTLHIVEYGQYRLPDIASARLDKSHLLTQGALAEVVELGL